MAETSLVSRLFGGWGITAQGRPKNPKVKTGRPSRAIVIHQPVDTQSKWSVSRVESAIARHEEGEFYDSAKLWEAMGRDDRIAGVLESRINALISKGGASFDILAGDNGNETYIEPVEEWWWKSLPEGTQRALLSDMVGMGFALARVPYNTEGNRWTPELVSHWPLHGVSWDDTKRRLVTQTSELGTVTIEPDDPNWIIITPGGERSWMGGAVRALGLLFAMRQFNWRDWARFNERHGQPLIAIKEPPSQDSKDKDAFWAGIRKMGSTGVVRLPKSGNKDDDADFEIEFIEAKDDAHESFKEFKQTANTAIAVVLLGQNLSTEVTGGSFAAATAHGKVRQDITDGDAETFSTCLKQQLILPWGTLNFDGFTEADAPNPSWNTGFAGDKALLAETYKAAAEGTQIMQLTGIPVDVPALFEKLGIPLIEGEEFDIRETAPATAATTPTAAAPATARGSFVARSRSGKAFRFDVSADGTIFMQDGHFHVFDNEDGNEVESTVSNVEGLHRHTVTDTEGEDIQTSADEEGADHTHVALINGPNKITVQSGGPVDEDESTNARQDDEFYEAMWSGDVSDDHQHANRRRIDRVAPTVASGIVAQAEGFIEGQAYADALTEHGVRNQASQFRGEGGLVEKVIVAIDSGSSYDEIREMVRDVYAEHVEPEEMAKIIEALWIMAHRAGQTAVDQDV